MKKQELLRNSLKQENNIDESDILQPCTNDVRTLRDYIKEQIRLIEEKSPERPTIPATIIQSEVFQTIGGHLQQEKPIADDSSIWAELEQAVLTVSPRFKEHVQLLAGTKLKTSEYRMLLLTKCGFSHGNISILMGRTKSTISYRRKQLNNLIFGGEVDLSQFDSIIRCI